MYNLWIYKTRFDPLSSKFSRSMSLLKHILSITYVGAYHLYIARESTSRMYIKFKHGAKHCQSSHYHTRYKEQ